MKVKPRRSSNLKTKFTLAVYCLFIITACSDENRPEDETQPTIIIERKLQKQTLAPPNSNKNAYFGDLHVHTTNSFDAYSFGTISSPADAYRFARGEGILHPTGYELRLSRPLDFYAVTDHAMFLGLLKEAADTSSEFSKYDLAKPLHNLNESVSSSFPAIIQRSNIFRPFARAVNQGLEEGTIDRNLVESIGQTVWQDTIEAADEAYEPGVFTTFAGYEYTSSIDLYIKYLHRNVIFRSTENLPPRLFSRLDSQDPERLWDWMDRLRANGTESLAIPHNSNLSGGAAFSSEDYNGEPIDEAYSAKRARNEPLTEITQAKGTSETHPILSKNDEWADFEAITGHDGEKFIKHFKGSFVRDAYLSGLTISENGLTDPFKFGLIGSSDTHVAAGSYKEESFFSKIGILDGTPELRGSVPFNRFYGTMAKLIRPEALAEVDGKNYLAVSSRLINFSASGLAAVWAEENTRDSIYDAFRRKETFATSGPRIKVRFFAGYGLMETSLDDVDLISLAYSSGVPMGGTLTLERETRPTFLVWAIADPEGGSLQRVQIIKGWLENDKEKEKVFDAACSDGMIVDPKTHRCPDNGARVNLSDCSTSAHRNASEIKAFWQDPEFQPDQKVFYYARVLENPVCRWSTWDAVKIGEVPRTDIPTTIQERAWSSPIWLQEDRRD